MLTYLHTQDQIEMYINAVKQHHQRESNKKTNETTKIPKVATIDEESIKPYE